ncbi:MAG: hypothetical protein IBX63_10715, partial [Coriobacteriia bacterium]|nr:hypothetical protein [Coriobacteriia bacterium]
FTGEKRRDKHEKVRAASDLWVPAVNNDGRFGTWKFIEVQDPYEAKALIRAALTDHDSERRQLSMSEEKAAN